MQIINSIITVGVSVLAIALLTYAIGKTFLGLPTFTATQTGGQLDWYNTMDNISVNTRTAFGLLGITPLVLGVSLIISILIGAFAYMYYKQG